MRSATLKLVADQVLAAVAVELAPRAGRGRRGSWPAPSLGAVAAVGAEAEAGVDAGVGADQALGAGRAARHGAGGDLAEGGGVVDQLVEGERGGRRGRAPRRRSPPARGRGGAARGRPGRAAAPGSAPPARRSPRSSRRSLRPSSCRTGKVVAAAPRVSARATSMWLPGSGERRRWATPCGRAPSAPSRCSARPGGARGWCVESLIAAPSVRLPA